MSTTTTRLSLFDDILNELERCDLMAERCQLALTWQAALQLTATEVELLCMAFGPLAVRNCQGVAFVLVERRPLSACFVKPKEPSL